MDRATQIGLLDRVVEHFRSGVQDMESTPSSFQAGVYCDETRARRESATLFSNFPLVVGASVQIPDAGSYITREINGVPILVSRQADGSVRGFLNICRHRGSRLVVAETGTCKRSHVCAYHGWTYGIDGTLRAIRHPENFDGIDPEVSSLVPLATGETAGLIFVVPNPRSSCDIDAYLGQYGRELTGFGLREFQWYEGRTVRTKHDWKLTIEANQETYHFGVLHRTTAGRRFRGTSTLFDPHGPHSRTLMMHKRFHARSLPESKDDWRLLEHGDLAYCLFPNTIVLLSHFAAHVLTVLPDGLGQALVYGFTLLPPGTRDAYRSEFFDVYWSTMGEDIEMLETIQTSAKAMPETVWWRGRNEHLLRRFNESIDAAVAGDLTANSVATDLGPFAPPVS